jgi:hypothetical protein
VTVGFRAHPNNDYVPAGNTGAAALIAGATPVTSTERSDRLVD